MKNKAIILCIYAFLITLGGVIGYFAAGSLASLISGITSGIILFICSYFIWNDKLWAYDLSLAILCFLLTFFCYRFVVTNKIAPSGILFLLTTFLLIYLGRTRPIKKVPKL